MRTAEWGFGIQLASVHSLGVLVPSQKSCALDNYYVENDDVRRTVERTDG